jgi:hypothetical protein
MISAEVKLERQKRYHEYIERNAPTLLAFYSFLAGVMFVAMLIMAYGRNEDPAPLGLKDFMDAGFSILLFGSMAALALSAFEALRRREGRND